MIPGAAELLCLGESDPGEDLESISRASVRAKEFGRHRKNHELESKCNRIGLSYIERKTLSVKDPFFSSIQKRMVLPFPIFPGGS
jgi:hypothetical protein